MNLNINIQNPVARQQETDFVIPILVDVLAPGVFAQPSVSDPEPVRPGSGAAPASFPLEDDSDEEFLVGRIWAERMDWFYAEECGFPVYAVCDARSGTWMQVLETISRNGGQSFRRDLQLDAFIFDIIFIHEVLLHPEILDRIPIVDAAIRGMSGENSLILMHHEQSAPHHMEDWECRDLGFKKISRSNLLLRDNHLRYPFSDSYTAGRRVSVPATVEHENWVLEHWEELITDHPSL